MTNIRRNFPDIRVWRRAARTGFVRGGGVALLAIVSFFLFAAHGLVRGQTRVNLACNAAPSPGHWSCLRIGRPKKYADRPLLVLLRDRRGGPVIQVRVPRENSSFLVPMVFASGKKLTPGYWPLEIKFSQPGNAGVWHLVQIQLPTSRTGLQQIAVPFGDGRRLTALRAAVIFPNASVMYISRYQLSSAPALCFAGCRWLLIGRKSASVLGRKRMESILAMGVNILYIGLSPPAQSKSLHWQAWQMVGLKSRIAPTLWRLYAQPPPPLILRRLGHLRLAPLAAPKAWFWLAVFCGPLVLLIIGLSYLGTGPNRTCRGFLLSLAVAAVLLGLPGLFYLRSTTHLQVAQFHWSTRCIESPLELTRTLCVYRDLRSGHIHSLAAGSTWPVATSANRWFALKGTIDVGRNATNAKLAIMPGQAVATFRQTWRQKPDAVVLTPAAIIGRNVAGHPLYSGLRHNAVVFRRGRIWTSGPHPQAIDFSDWLAGQSAGPRANLRAWLATEFSPARQYIIQIGHHSTGAKPSAIEHSAALQVITVP